MRKFNYEIEPAQIMRAIIKDHGKQIFFTASKKNLSEVINKSYGKHEGLREILLKAVDFGIPASLLGLYAEIDRDRQIRGIVRRFAEENDFLPESAEINEAVSCFTFALDYGVFQYSPYPPRFLQETQTQTQQYIDLKDIVESQVSTQDIKDADEFMGIKDWFEKTPVEERRLKERDISKIYIKGADSSYYALSQTDFMTESGTNFKSLYANFDKKKKVREIIKMGIDICVDLEMLESRETSKINLNPSNIYRNKYGNYRLGDERAQSRGYAASGNEKKKNPAQELGFFIGELIGTDGTINNLMLEEIARKACGNG